MEELYSDILILTDINFVPSDQLSRLVITLIECSSVIEV